MVCGSWSAGASVSAPQGLGLGTTLALSFANTCLNVDGSCSLTPIFSVGSTDNRLSVDVTFPETASGMTITLPSPDVSVSAFLNTGSATSQPTVVSGTLTVESVSPSGFQASFDLQLMTDDGQVITITGGQASVSGCGVHQMSSSCGSFS